MSTKLNVEIFVAVLKKSGLLDQERIQRALNEYTSTGGANDSTALSEWLIAANLLTKWQVEKLSLGKHRGYFLGKYKLLSLLGKGGMSSVYLAEHLLMRRRCALKVLPAKKVDDSSYLERFHREAQAVAALDHPSIVRAYDVDHQNDGDRQIHFLVMEYVEGQSLQDMVSDGGLGSFLDAADYTRQAAAALQHAHENGMIHRDVKPANLLVDSKGLVKILDLGLARFFKVDEGNEALTIRHDEKVLGTADYLAPEQALDSHTVDARADIYSLGCTLYFLLTGRPPFNDGTLAQRLLAHQVKTPPNVESLRPDMPLGLVTIIRKMMEKQPGDRYQTMAEAGAALSKWIGDNSDHEWRRARSALLGPNLSDSWAAPKVVPIARPVGLMTSGEVEPTQTFPAPIVTEPRIEPPRVNVTEEPTINRFFAAISDPGPAAIEQTVSEPEATVPVEHSPQATEPRERNDIATTFPTVTGSDTYPMFDSRERAKPQPKKITPSTTPRSRKRAPSAGWSKWHIQSLIAGGAVLGLLVLIYAAGGFSRHGGQSGRSTSNSEPFPRGQQEVVVGGKGADYRTIREALVAVRDRYRPSEGSTNRFIIRIRAGTYQERIRIDGRTNPWPEGITLRGEGDVTLESQGEDAVIRLANVFRFTVENLQIAATQHQVAVELTDDLHECRLTNLVVSGFTDAGIVCKGTQGLSFGNGQLMLDQVTFDPATSQAVGIRLEQGPENDVYNVVIRRCRFLHEMTAGVTIQGRSPFGIDIAESTFYQTTDGIRVLGQPILKSLHVTNNSFRETKHGIWLEKIPNDLSADLLIRRNLFSKTKSAEVVIAEGYDETRLRAMVATNPPGIENNWSDRAKSEPTPGELSFLFEQGGRQNELNFAFESTDPKSSKFLAPTSQSSQRDVSGAQAPDKKWVGAIGPQ